MAASFATIPADPEEVNSESDKDLAQKSLSSTDLPPTSIIGSLANLYGLVKVPELNGQIGSICDFDASTERYMVRTLCRKDIIKVRRANLSLPATCPYCRSEVTSLCCYSCTHTPLSCESDHAIAPATRPGDCTATSD